MLPEQSSRPRRRIPTWVLAGCVGLLLFACMALVLAGGVGWYLLQNADPAPTAVAVGPLPTALPAATRAPADPTALPSAPADAPPTTAPTPSLTPTTAPPLDPPAAIEQEPADEQAHLNLARLWAAAYPAHDYYAVARRLGKYDVGDRTVPPAPVAVGDRRTFFVDDGTVDAELLAATDLVYFWVEDGLRVDSATVAEILAEIEQVYYPTLADLFGGEWRPGVDNDPHFSILHLDGFTLGEDIGYFDSVNQYPRAIDASSNEQEIIFMNMSELAWGEPLYYGTLVHEIQHMMQWYQDSNETVWLDEALAQLAEHVTGLMTAESADYLLQPTIQLTSWDYDDDVYAHYGAAYLFGVYLWEQLGAAAVRDLARDPANGLTSVRNVLDRYAPGTTVEQFVGDWAVANWLNNKAVDPRYGYDLELFLPDSVERVRRLPFTLSSSLPQYGVHYVALEHDGPMTLAFAGDTRVPFVPVQPFAGRQMWVAPPLNDLNAQLTTRVDLTGVDTATLSFRAWYDLEDDWDYAYVLVSADSGTSWDILAPRHGAPGIYGPAFNGRSRNVRDAERGWVEEAISLNAYVGREVWVRFEVLSDSAETRAGFALDNIAVPEVGFFDDVEGQPQWTADGFVQTGSTLPQQWNVYLIYGGNTPRVEQLPLNQYNQGVWTRELPFAGGTLVVMPVTPFIERDADYWLEIDGR